MTNNINKSCKKHEFMLSSYSLKSFEFRCLECGIRKKRAPTKKEELWCKASKKESNVHKVWHEFCEEIAILSDETRNIVGLVDDWRKKTQRLQKKYPQFIRIVGCDDSYHMNADLIFIEHMVSWFNDMSLPPKYMGTTVIFVPQQGSIATFFLYPDHLADLQKTLLEISTEASVVKEMEHADQVFAVQRYYPHYEDGDINED